MQRLKVVREVWERELRGENGVFLVFGVSAGLEAYFQRVRSGISGFELAVFLFSHNRERVRLNPISITVLITHFLFTFGLIRSTIYFEQSNYA